MTRISHTILTEDGYDELVETFADAARFCLFRDVKGTVMPDFRELVGETTVDL